MEKTNVLASLLKEEQVPMETLHQRYKPVLELVRILIGVVPNCDTYLEIWPPAFRTYNIMVPNLLNLPFGIFGFGGAPKDLVGLSLYVSSYTAECPYCTAHTCSYAMRRGATPETVAKAIVGGDHFTEQELATIAVARSLAKIPCEITQEERDALHAAFSPKDAEWIVLGTVNMGFLNKFMDAISVELESATVAETTAVIGAGWSTGKSGRDLDPNVATKAPPDTDSFWTKLSVLKYAPKALQMDKAWLRGVPDGWPQVGDFLKEISGYAFPVLSNLKNTRALRAIAAILRENLNAKTTEIGLKTKVWSSVIFAYRIADPSLAEELHTVGKHFGVTQEEWDRAIRYVSDEKVTVSDDPKTNAAMVLVKAASPSPAEITTEVVDTCRDTLTAPEIVEVITWISVLQMLHRLSCYYLIAD